MASPAPSTSSSPSYPTSFESVLDLARLPWFEVRGGNRLVLVDDGSVGPIIDMHTHLALGFIRRLRVDVNRSTPTTAYYLPLTLPIDLDRYSNKNFDDESLWSMKLDNSLLLLSSWGKRVTHTAPNLVRDMHDLGIGQSVVLPIDLPVGARNADAALAAARRYPELLAFGSVHPMERGIEAEMDRQQAAGAIGIKLHPNAQFIAPDHAKTVHLCGRCGERGLPVLFHCGPVGIEPKAARKRSQVHRYEATLAENPDTVFILGHCGALQHAEAILFAEKYPNTWFELSCLGLSAVRDVIDTVPHDRILYGTDWPFYHQSLTLARVLIATDDRPELRRAILHDNAARLLKL